MRQNKLEIGAEKLDVDLQTLRQRLINLKTEWSAFTKDRSFMIKYQEVMDAITNAKTAPEKALAQAQMRLFEKEVIGAGKNVKTIMGQLVDGAKKFTQWFFIGGGIASAVRGIKEIVTNVRELNSSLVSLQMATNLPKKQATELMKTYSALGKEIGATTSQVTNAATDWLRQGYDQEQAALLTKNSMVLSKVGAIESAQATEYLTTAMKGYKIAVTDSLSVVDKLSAVDLVSATSAGGLAEGMAEVANNADMAGISIEKLLGYLAVIGKLLPI